MPVKALLLSASRLVISKAGQRRRFAKIFATAVALAIFVALTGPGARADQGDVVLRANEQLFDVLAAINAAGYNNGVGIEMGDGTREAVRAELAAKKVAVLPSLQTFYAAHAAGLDPGENLAQYVSLALLLGPPPDFKFVISPEDLPPDAHNIMNFVPLLKKYYKEANLVSLWAREQPHYQAAIARYSGPVRHTIDLTDGYLRISPDAYLGRTYTIDIDLLGAPEQVQGRIYRSDYFLVVTPSAHLQLQRIRYQYLHFLLDPLAAEFVTDVEKSSSLLAIARKAPALSSDYKNDFPLLMTECLVRAAEIRMDKPAPADGQKQAWKLAEQGFILTPYFYKALEAFEKQPSGMGVYYKDMVDAIKPGREASTLASLKFSAPEKAPLVPAPRIPEKERILDEGDNDIYQGKYEEAKSAYEQVLKRLDPQSAQALYGIAVANSYLRKPDLAKEYFHKTLQITRDPRLVTWSHIYLGRIDDLNGDRKSAIAQYRAASVTAAAFPEALRAVQQGLQIPYGSK